MKAVFHTSANPEKSLEELATLLKGKGFLFAEEDKTYDFRREGDKVRAILISTQFWSRKDLAEEGPPNYSLVIQGEARQESGGSIIELELIEYHGNHPHRLGGKSVEKYANELAKTINTK